MQHMQKQIWKHFAMSVIRNKLTTQIDQPFPFKGDDNRVKLKEIPGVEGSDYINVQELVGTNLTEVEHFPQ